MSKSIKIGIAAVVISILFEIITYWYGLHENINASAISFMVHSFVLISSVAITIISVSKHKDFNDIISQLKAGIKTTSIYAVFMSCFFFSYNKWINPNYMDNRRNHLIELTKDDKTREVIRKEIEANGIAKFQKIVNQTITPQLLKWKGVEATQEIAKSSNSKVIVIGNGDGDLPIILGGQ